MEHKLILGGEIYLPFARSRIKALRATGLEYASQQFEIDGVSVKVRIMPGHDYIWLDGGKFHLDMDSGIIEMSAHVGVDQFLPGTFYESGYSATYNAPFSRALGLGWRGLPKNGTTPVPKKVTGSFQASKSGKFDCKVRVDASESRSVTAGKIANVLLDGSTEYIDQPEDGGIVQKKLLMRICPPSIFTGRCRLYAQALYGRPAYAEAVLDKDGRVRKQPETNAWPTIKDENVYMMELRAYSPPGKPLSGSTVVINTSTGVYLDKETGNHWLFNLSYETLSIFPLVSSPAGEALRKLLKTNSKITGDELEHLETHILAESAPDATKRVDIALNIEVYPSSCGYGWHWNRSGTKADIIINGTYGQILPNSDYRGMESTHFRLSVTAQPLVKGQSRTFGASVQIIEGPTRWAVDRQAWCIAYPLPSAEAAIKLTPRYSIPIQAKGFFYAFYKDDELIRCGIDVEQISIPDESIISPSYFGPPYQARTRGLESGSFDTTDYNPAHFTGKFTFGGYAAPQVTMGYYKFRWQGSVKEKTVVALETFNSGNSFGPLDIPSGPEETPVFTHFPVVVLSEGGSGGTTYKLYVTTISNVTVRYLWSQSSQTDTIGSQIGIVIPLDDSEAIYYGGHQSTTVSKTGVVSDWGSVSFLRYQSVDGVQFVTERTADAGSTGAAISTTAMTPTSETTLNIEFGHLLCRAGILPVTFTAEHFASFSRPTSDLIDDPFRTRTGYRISDPCVMWSKSAPVGTAGHGIGFSSIVGWI